MMAYWIMFALPFVGAMWPVDRSLLSRAILWAGLALFVLVIVGLRDKIGGDWVNYLEAYSRIKEEGLGPALGNRSVGYGMVNYGASAAGWDIYGVNLVCAGFFLAGLLRFSLYQPLPCLAWLIATPYLIVVVAMGYTAQSVAVGFTLLVYVSILERQRWTAIFAFIMAVLFHKSAVFTAFLFLGMLFLEKQSLLEIVRGLRQYLSKQPLLLISGFLILVLIGVQLAPGVYQTLGYYLFSDHWDSTGGTIRVLMNAVPAALFLMLGQRLVLKAGALRFWRFIAIVALACVPLLLINSTLADRLSIYLIPLQLFVFCRLPMLFGDSILRKGAILLIGVGYGIVQWVWLMYANHAYEWVPYQNILLL